MSEFSPITGHFGAEVSGINLVKDSSSDVIDAIKQGLLDHKVLVFNDQHEMTPARHAELIHEFGQPNIHPFFPRAEGHAEIDLLQSQGVQAREGWHTDLGFESVPNLVTILRAVEIPAYGRDTGFLDCEAVYDGLSEPLKKAIEDLVGVRDWRHIFQPESRGPGVGYVTIPDAEFDRRDKNMPAQEYRIVSVNPETGRKALSVDTTFTTRIVGMRDHESRALLRLLFDELHYPEYQMRARWRPGTMVMWDNRTTLHAMIFDGHFPRVMHRTISKGYLMFPERAERAKAA